jgi:hypothetical protein
VTLGLTADAGNLHVVLLKRLLNVSLVRDIELARELLISLVDPIRLRIVVGNHDQLEARMRRDTAGQIIVFDNT